MSDHTPYLVTEDSVIRAIVCDELNSFSEIPPHLTTDRVIHHWLMCGSLEGVPLERLGIQERALAVASDARNIQYFNRHNCDNYSELLKIAMISSRFTFKDVDLDLIRPDTLALIFRKNPDRVQEFFKIKVWGSDEQRIQFLNEMVACSPVFVMCPFINFKEITDETLARSVGRVTDMDFYLRKLVKDGRSNVLDLLVKADRWGDFKKPHDLMSAVWRLMRADRNKTEFQLLAAYIRQYPIEEVCGFMKRGSSRQEILVDIFPREQVMPHIKSMPSAKRHLLDKDFDI